MFNFNWTKKTKIVVDGKEYERLEDLPEHLRALLKDSDGDGVPDVAAQGKQTWKIKTLFKLNTPQNELMAEPAVPVALPKGFRLDHHGKERRISWRWISLRAAGAFVFFLFWDSIVASVIYAMSLSKNTPLFAIAGMLVLAIVGVTMTYILTAYLINRTSVRVDSARVSVRHGPLPWFGDRDISKAAIDQVLCEKQDQLDDDAGWEPQVTYQVKLRFKGGSTLTLVSGLHAPEQALFLSQQIRSL